MAAIGRMMKTYPIIAPIKRSFGDSHWEYKVIIAAQKIFTTVTSNNLVVDQWITDVHMMRRYYIPGHLIVGFDAWCPPPYNRRIGAIQLCFGHSCLVYQISVAAPSGISLLLDYFLKDQTILFAGVDIRTKIVTLQRDYGIGQYAQCMDLGCTVAGVWRQGDLARADLKRLAEVVMATEFFMVSPALVSRRWDVTELTDWQVLYATVNAFLSFEIARTLNVRQLLPPMPSNWVLSSDSQLITNH